MRRKTHQSMFPIKRKRGYRRLSGPEQVESRCLMDGALPQLVADVFTVHTNDDPQLLEVLSNDAWNGYSGAKRITALSFPTGGGAADVSSDGKSVEFRPSADFSGDDTFSYVVDDQFTANLTVHVVSPLASDTVTVYPGTQPRTLDVLTNDPFWANYAGERRITSLSATQLGGTVSIGADGRTVTYGAPDDPANLGQTDHFSYIVDGKFSSDVAVFLFKPLESFSQNVPQNSDPIQLAPLEHSNFSEWVGYAGPRLVTKVLNFNPGSSVSIDADGRSISYRPAKDFLGTDTITYVIDGKFSSTIMVQVGAVAMPDSYQVDENDAGTVLKVLQNDFYYDPSVTTPPIATQVTGITQPTHGGHVEIVQGGLGIRYTPAAGFIGSESFMYRANGKYTASVIVDVSRPVRDDFLANSGMPVSADSRDNVLDVLANDFFRPGTHAITDVGTPSQGGAVTIHAGGQKLSYSPKPGFVGQDQFTYTVDGHYTATVYVAVQSPATDIYQELEPARNHSYRVDLAPELRGLSGYGGNGLVTAVSVVTGNVTAAISADGQAMLITPNDFSYATISYTIDGKYTARVSVSFSYSRFLGFSSSVVEENLPSQIDVLANAPWQYAFNDQFMVYQLVVYPGARLITDAFGAQHGTVSVAADGKSVTYRPSDNYVGQDTFQYLVDGHELESATVQTIRRVRDDQFHVDSSSHDNLLPVELNDQLGGGYTGVGLITRVGTATHGTASIAADGRSLLYTPTAGYTGADSVAYIVDGHLKATVEITVAASAESAYPQFSGLAALEDGLLQNAIKQYGSLFGQPGFGGPIYFGLNLSDAIPAAARTSGSMASHSETNVQVASVDEADLTESDSNFLYVLSGGKLVISQVHGTSPLAVVSQTHIEGAPIGIYLSGDRLTVISQSGYSLFQPDLSSAWFPRVWGVGQTTVSVFDVTDRGHPLVVQKTVFDGTQFDSRKIGDFVYLVLNNHNLSLSAPQIVGSPPDTAPVSWGTPSGRYETQEEYVARVRDHFGELLDSILPHFRSFGPDGSLVRSGVLLTPEEIGMPLDPADQSLLSIVTINTTGSEPGIVAATGVLSAPGGKLYMNHDSLYLLGQKSWGAEGQATDILKFTFDEATGQVAPVAHGQVPGFILDQFSVDESHGSLRIATTVSNAGADNWSGRSENDLWVLRQDGNLLELVGGLQNLAHGESIRSVRYDGNRAVITTFPTAQVGFDPVYTIDLTDPTQPRFVGELTLPGFNQYMQFIDDTHVLTVGVNAPTTTAFFWTTNTLPLQISLFDVSDFAHPHLLDQYTLARFSISLAQQDHHAFGWFADIGILALPIARNYTKREDLDGDGYRETTTVVNADEVEYFRIRTTGSADAGRPVQFVGAIELTTAALRSEFIGNTLYAIGDGQIVASSIHDPGAALASACWPVPPIIFPPFYPIHYLPIFPRSVSINSLAVLSNLTPANVGAVATSAPVEPQQLETWIEAARNDLAGRLGVPAESALLVSVEAPTLSSGENSTGVNDPTGLKFVLRSANQALLYQVTSNSSVQLVDSGFHFPSAAVVAFGSVPTPDVNQDGQVTSRDALQVINDLRRHAGAHRDEGAVLRQLMEGSSFLALDVNRDGFVTSLDALLVINALELETITATKHAPTASGLPPTGPFAASLQIASGAFLGQITEASNSVPSAALGNSLSAAAPATPAPSASLLQLSSAVMATRLRQNRHDATLAATEDWSPLADLSSFDEANSR